MERNRFGGVSGVEDLSASEDNHELAGHDKDFSDDPLAQFEETFLEDGEDIGGVEALSSADLYDGNGETKLAGMGQGGLCVRFFCLDKKRSIGFFRWGFGDEKQQWRIRGPDQGPAWGNRILARRFRR